MLEISLLLLFYILPENKKVFLSLGIISKIWLISFSKSIFNNLSASSITKNFNLLKVNPLVFCKWYKTLPGVPITKNYYMLYI